MLAILIFYALLYGNVGLLVGFPELFMRIEPLIIILVMVGGIIVEWDTKGSERTKPPRKIQRMTKMPETKKSQQKNWRDILPKSKPGRVSSLVSKAMKELDLSDKEDK